jgi:preprotein translocase subunit SecF
MRIFKDTNIRFMKYKGLYFLFSSLLLAFAVFSWFKFGLNYGIDFAGGTQMIMKYKGPVTVGTLDDIRGTLTGMNLGDVIVHEYGVRDEQGNIYSVLIRVEASSEEVLGADEEKRVDIAELITQSLQPEYDKGQISTGKEDLNSVGKTKLEDYLKTTDLAPSNIPGYINELLSDDDRENLSQNEIYYRVLSTAIIDYRERADVGVLKSFDELYRGNENVELVAANNGNKPNLINESVINKLREKYFLGTFAVIGVEMVGPSVGSDLRSAAVASIISALIGILIYITIRFKFRFGVAAIIALIHDVIITTGIFAFSGKEFTLPIVAALLTIVGYSLNDTIVVSDRIRENVNKYRREDFSDVVNISINNTLSRTLLTSLTTLFVIICLLVLGGEVLSGFAFALFIGVIIGTYSSICVASPVLVVWRNVSDKYQKVERGTDYVKKSLKTLFPEQDRARREAMKAKPSEGATAYSTIDSELKPKQHTPKRRTKKGITGKKRKKKKKRR